MKKTTSKALASTALTALIAGIIPVGQVSAAANTEFQRLSGKDRYLTAVEVSKAGWVEGAEYAVVANGEAYADALSAAPFAKESNAPILLTSSKGIATETINELKRLKVKKVYVIGETGVVPNSILDTIKKNVTANVERIGGLDRYATSTKIAEKLGEVSEAILASGEGYADALSAAPVAAVKGMPVLLTKAGELPKATSDYIKAHGIKKTFVVGGTASVSDKVKGLVPDAVRLGGKNRFETNSEIVKSFALDFNFDGAYIALANGVTGKEFADALTASAIAAKGGHPVIISNKTADTATTALINEKLSPTAKITAIGGTANLSDALINAYKVKGEVIEASKNVTGNAVVSKDDVALNDMKVTGNLYLEGDNAALTNVEVSGTVFVNPGAEGEAVLDNVTANRIVVLSGASNTIQFKNVKAASLNVLSNSDVRIKTEGTTAITNTTVESKVILEATEGSFGDIKVLETVADKQIEFRGKFDKPVVIAGQATLKTAENAEVPKVQVATENKNSKVVFDGTFKAVEVVKAATVNVTANAKIEGNFSVKAEVALDTAKGAKIENIVVTEEAKNAKVDVKGEGTINNIQNKSQNATINIGKDTEVTGKIETVNKDSIKSENPDVNDKVEEKDSDDIEVPEDPSDPGQGGGGGGGDTAEEIAVKAINDADVAGMDAAIKANATTLGLNLTDYNALKDNSSVINAMVVLEGANKSTIVSIFNTAVAAQKAAETLAQAKTAAIADLNEYKTKSDYSELNWTLITEKKQAGIVEINKAITEVEVEAALAAAKADIDTVKTSAQEEAQSLAEAKADALAQLNSYKVEKDYSNDNWNKIKDKKATAVEAINNATTKEAVKVELAAAIADINTVKTLAQEEAEALAQAKTKAKDELATEFAKYTETDYTAENWALLTKAKADGDKAIDEATTTEAVGTAKDDAIAAMGKVEKIVVTEDVLKDTIEKTIKNYNDFKTNNPDEISSYPTVVYDTNARTVTITMDGDKSTNRVSDTFNFKAKNGIVTESRLKELERLLSLTGINVGNKSLVDYIVTSEVVPSYITGGKVDYAKIAEDLKAGEFTFADVERVFNGLIDKMNNKKDEEGNADNIVPEVAVEGLTLKTITSNKNEVIMDFENVDYETLKANMDNMFEVTSYNDDLTYGKLEGIYTLTFEDANGQELTYKIDVELD